MLKDAISPWEENKERHANIISKLEKIRLDYFDVGIPVNEIKQTHKRIVERIEKIRRENEASSNIHIEQLAEQLSENTFSFSGDSAEIIEETEKFNHISEPEPLSSPASKTEPVTKKRTAYETKTSLPDHEESVKQVINLDKNSGDDKASKEKTRKNMGNFFGRIRRPIMVKLISIVFVILFLSLSTTTLLVSIIISFDVELTAYANNFSINKRNSDMVYNELNNVRSSVAAFVNDITIIGAKSPDSEIELSSFFFQKNPDISAVVVMKKDFEKRYIMPEIEKSGITLEKVSSLMNSIDNVVELSLSGGTVFKNTSDFFYTSQLAMIFPVEVVMDMDIDIYGVSVLFSQEGLNAMLNSGANISFLLSDDGTVLVHNDPALVLSAANFSKIPFVENALSPSSSDSKSAVVQKNYVDENGVEYIGVFQRSTIGDLILVTIIEKDSIFRGIIDTTRRNIIISLIVLALSIFVVVLFARTISEPLRSLIGAVGKIENGNYNNELKCRNSDEIGNLTESITNMQYGLENFEKFTNKGVVRLARSGKLIRGGVNKEITVSFIVVRDFSEFSAKMNAAQVVGFINEYLERVVPCITYTGGVVDKFLTHGGVIIMALWGALDLHEMPETQAFNCLRSMIMIRSSLMDFNRDLSKRFWGYLPLIKMGCGINSGKVIVGSMGSERRMEYTVIGDTVNMAARLEGVNDLFDTDILISENTLDLLKKKIITEELPKIEVKGKEKPLGVFSVVGMSELKGAVSVFDDLDKIQNKSGPEKHVIKYIATSMDDVRKLWKSNMD